MQIAQLAKPNEQNILMAADLLKQGQVVAMPTETVYGLAGNAFDVSALERIFLAKERPTFDPLIVHVAAPAHVSKVDGPTQLAELATLGLISLDRMSDAARKAAARLMATFWPGPLTLVLPKQRRVPDLATAGLDTVAIRMPAHPVAQRLITAAATPLAAPSANRFGRISPTTAKHVAEELGSRIPLIIDGGPCIVGLESTVVAVLSEPKELILLRPGRVTSTELETSALIKVKRGTPVTTASTVTTPNAAIGPTTFGAPPAQASPGLLTSHYAPSKALHLLPDTLATLSDDAIKGTVSAIKTSTGTSINSLGLLIFEGSPRDAAARLQRTTGLAIVARTLSSDGSIAKVARNFFGMLRELDHAPVDAILSEPCPDSEASDGLGYAVADRLRRASAR